MRRSKIGLLAAIALVTVPLAGCLVPKDVGGTPATVAPQVREIRMWVEPLDWEVHPGVTTPVWAFCAEGDGVEPVHDGPCGVPGPTIRVNKGDTIRLTFENTHSIPHTVHFHGWHKYPADFNGNGILGDHHVAKAGETETIEWVAEPAGSFIYHCHFETPTHMEMGMYGAFIVEHPEEEKPDREFVAILDEWAIRDEPEFQGSMPVYNYFTINGKSFPLTRPWVVEQGERVRIHMVNAGYEFHAFHIHGYTPTAWEGVAGPRHGVPTDVREVAPGQTVVFEFDANREGVWLAHDHVVPRVTAAADGRGFGAYPRGMLTILAVGDEAAAGLGQVAPALVEAASKDASDPRAGHEERGHGADDGTTVVEMKDVKFPAEIRIPAGTTVRWVNKDPMMHTVTANGGRFDSGEIRAGDLWSYKFEEPGTYEYRCVPHAYQDKGTGAWKGMVGTVVVEAA